MSNYARNSELKISKGVDVWQFAQKEDLANLNSAVDRLDIGKLEKLDVDKLVPVPADLS